MSTNAEVIDVLRRARARISTPERWTQDVYARDAEGRGTLPSDDSACCWCAIGAIELESGGPRNSDDAVSAIRNTIRPMHRYVDEWNDAPERTHAEVLAAFDAAIARLEAEGK